MCNNSKNVKIHVFWILKKNVKKIKNVRTVSEVFNTELLKVSTGKSLTSNILLRNADVVFTFTRNFVS